MLGLSPVTTFRKVVFPAALPTIFTGIRIAGAAAILVLIAAEMIGATAGLGYLINYSQYNFLIPQMYAAILTTSALGLAVNYGLVSHRTPLLALARVTSSKGIPTMTRQLNLNAFLMSTGHHEASWRLPESDPLAAGEVTHFQNLARIAERGKLDSVFFADSPSLFSNPARRPPVALEPTLLLAAMAVVTERIGLVATASTTYEEPYNLARSFASLDAISHGRAGWNVVTTAALDAGANFGFEESPTHAERYERANEFLEVVLGLWDGWEDDAAVVDKAGGVHTDPAKVHALDHRGKHFRVRGPLTVGRSEQGHPVVVQAGSSGPGIALAAAYAEAVFTAQRTLEEGQAFYRELKAATAAAGRNPDHVKILPGIVPIIGGHRGRGPRPRATARRAARARARPAAARRGHRDPRRPDRPGRAPAGRTSGRRTRSRGTGPATSSRSPSPGATTSRCVRSCPAWVADVGTAHSPARRSRWPTTSSCGSRRARRTAST